MLCLSIETSTKTCAVALVDENKTLAEIVINSEFTHSQKLLPAIDMLLKSLDKNLSDIELIGVSVGPGSFTGLRIGIATAKGLVFGKNIPVVGISTLEGLAQASNCTDKTVVPILNARRNQVYTAIFEYSQGAFTRKMDDSVIKLEELMDKLKGLEGEFIFTGDGVFSFSKQVADSLGERASFVSTHNCVPKGFSIGQLAIKKY